MGLSGLKGFESHYASIYGTRWPGISKALRKGPQYTTLIPPFITEIPEQAELEGINEELSGEELDGATYYRKTDMPFCYESLVYDSASSKDGEITATILHEKKPIFNANSFVSTVVDCAYTMDYAVAFACHCLGVKPGDKVLDLFAHTGAHSLLFSSILFYETTDYAGVSDKDKSTMELVNMINKLKDKMQPNGTNSLLVCCEPRRSMHEKSIEILKKYVPAKWLNSMSVQSVCYEPEDRNLRRFGTFDRIFVRMPQLYDRNSLHQWTYRGAKTNSTRALSALNSAVKLLKPNGSMIYCNQSLDPLDNELVIHTLLASTPSLRHETIDIGSIISDLKERVIWKTELQSIPTLETRKYGHALMPDDTPYGPIYICKLVLSNN